MYRDVVTRSLQEYPRLDAVLEAFHASVRPMLAYSFAGAMLWGLFSGKITPDAFLGVAAMVIGFFYHARSVEKVDQQLQAQQQQLVELAPSMPPPKEEGP